MDRLQKLKDFLTMHPGDSFSRHALALELVKGGDDLSAMQQFRILLENDPSYVGSYYHLGKILERQGDTLAALHIYHAGIEWAMKKGDHHAAAELRSAADYIEN